MDGSEEAAAGAAERRVLVALGTAWALTAAWFLFWPVPTEVVGRGVVIVPGGATVIDSRAEGQILSLPVREGQRVIRGQTLIRLYLPTLEQQLRRQEKDLAELIRINADLDRRDRSRLASARRLRDTALAKLEGNRERLDALRRVYAQKVADFRHLARREVVAPLAAEVVASEDRAIQLDNSVAELGIRQREAIDAWEKVRLAIETEAQRRRFAIQDARRAVRVTQTRLTYDGTLTATRDGRLLDLQVVRGQTVKPGQRLGTLGSPRRTAATPMAAARPCRRWPTSPRPMPAACAPAWPWRWCRTGTSGAASAASAGGCATSTCCPPPARTSTPPWATPSWRRPWCATGR